MPAALSGWGRQLPWGKSSQKGTSPTEPGGKWICLGNLKVQFSLFFFFLEEKNRGCSQHLTEKQICVAPPPPKPLPQNLLRGRFETKIKTVLPLLWAGRKRGWHRDGPQALLCDPGSLGLDSHAQSPRLKPATRQNPESLSHKSPTSLSPVDAGTRRTGLHKPYPKPHLRPLVAVVTLGQRQNVLYL